MPKKLAEMTFGVIVGNRGFFPDALAKEGHDFYQTLFKKLGWKCILLNDKDTKFGSVETWEDAKKCAALFKEHREAIDGVIVTLPNFGDERGVADTLKLAGLDVPVLIHAWQDDAAKMTIKNRRDSFCGKMSVCNNLLQYNIPHSLTLLHTMAPSTPLFKEELEWFAAVCRVVKGLKKCRIGALGARPAAFSTVRYSEKLLQDSGITVETMDLSEMFVRAEKLDTKSKDVQAKIAAISAYTKTTGIPVDALVRMGKLALVIDRWMESSELDITAIQCWTSMEEYFGVVPCTIMSMLSESLRSAACEVDVCGAVSMHALALASATPSFLLDWNNNYGNDVNKCVCFHCSNAPKTCFASHKMDYQEIIAGTVGKERTYGTIVGRIKPSPLTFARITTNDHLGEISAYVGEGRFTNDKLDTFGGYGVVEIPDLQVLLRHICQAGYEHHVAGSMTRCARAVHEAFDNYMGWDTYWHMD